MNKAKIFGGLFTIILIFIITIFVVSNNQPTDTVSSFEQLNPQQREQIGESWNPPKNKECEVIIGLISAVTIDDSYTEVSEIKAKIIENTRLAAARLSVLAQKSLDTEIASWSYKVALLLAQFPEALAGDNQRTVSSLYDAIGKMVQNPPTTCDNTLNLPT